MLWRKETIVYFTSRFEEWGLFGRRSERGTHWDIRTENNMEIV